MLNAFIQTNLRETMRSLMMAAQVHAKTLCAKADNFSTLSPR